MNVHTNNYTELHRYMHEKLLSSQFLPLLFPLELVLMDRWPATRIYSTIYQEWGIDYCRITNVYRLAVRRTRFTRGLFPVCISDPLASRLITLWNSLMSCQCRSGKHKAHPQTVITVESACAIPPLVVQPLGVVAVEVNGFTLPNLSSTTASFLEGSCNISSIKKKHDSGSCWPTCASWTIVINCKHATNINEHDSACVWRKQEL